MMKTVKRTSNVKKKAAMQKPRKVSVVISVDEREYIVASNIAKNRRKSPEYYLGGGSTQSLIVDSEEEFGKDSEQHQLNLKLLGVKP